jgi:hypothetical protein
MRGQSSCQTASRGHANRAWCKGPCEGRSLVDQPVKRRGANNGVAQGCDCIESLLIGHQQKKIGTFGTHFGSKKQENAFKILTPIPFERNFSIAGKSGRISDKCKNQFQRN